jgi:hypothetical protein
MVSGPMTSSHLLGCLLRTIEKYITANAASNTPPNIKIKIVSVVQFPSVAANHECPIVVALNPPRSGLFVLGVSEPRQLTVLPVIQLGAFATSAWYAHLMGEAGGQEHTNGFALVL